MADLHNPGAASPQDQITANASGSVNGASSRIVFHVRAGNTTGQLWIELQQSLERRMPMI